MNNIAATGQFNSAVALVASIGDHYFYMVVVGCGCQGVDDLHSETGEATGGGTVVAGTTDGLRAGSERRGWWLLKPTATGRTWADVALQRGGCGADGGGGGRCHTKQIPGWPGYSGCRRCSATDHRSSGCTGAGRSQGQLRQQGQQGQSLQQRTQVVTLQNMVDDEVQQHGEHWARIQMEMALRVVSAGEKKLWRSRRCRAAAARAGGSCEDAVGAAAGAAGCSPEKGQASAASCRESEGQGHQDGATSRNLSFP